MQIPLWICMQDAIHVTSCAIYTTLSVRAMGISGSAWVLINADKWADGLALGCTGLVMLVEGDKVHKTQLAVRHNSRGMAIKSRHVTLGKNMVCT
jgi:hypothetical protein